MSFLLQWLSQALTWFFHVLDVLPLHIWVLVLQGLAAVVAAIPVPSWLSSAPSYVAALPPWVLYICASLQVPTGLGIILSAYAARFVLRRIPLIGG